MLTDVMLGFGSMIAGALLAVLPYMAWSYWARKKDLVAKPGLQWIFLVWGALWISQGIRYSLDSIIW